MARSPTCITGATYGSSFSDGGFSHWFGKSEFADVVVQVITRQGGAQEWRLHGLVLAHRSAFFHRALIGDFTEGHSKVVKVHLEASGHVWPQLCEYFYTDRIHITEDNVMPLLALSRQLLVASVDAFCTEFVAQRLSVANCMHYLHQAVTHQLSDVHKDCVTLAAKGFHFLFDANVAGVPPATVLEILRHEDLLVHCEQQVLHFVLRYLASTQLDSQAARAVVSEIRFPFLDNSTLSRLLCVPAIPQHLLLAGCVQRLGAMDAPAEGCRPSGCGAALPLLSALQDLGASAHASCGPHGSCAGGEDGQELSGAPASGAAEGMDVGPSSDQDRHGTTSSGGHKQQPAAESPIDVPPAQPRSTYCCDVLYSLPGGSSHLTVDVSAGSLWEVIAAHSTVRVSGVTEGLPEHVLSAHPEAWFETDESSDPLPWVEVQLPRNVTIVKMTRYSFAHGHRRSGYFRMRKWETQVRSRLDDERLLHLATRVSPTDQFEVHVATHDQGRPWQALRLQGSDRQEDAVFRLCVRNVRVAGIARIDLTAQEGGLVITPELIARIKRDVVGSQQQQQALA